MPVSEQSQHSRSEVTLLSISQTAQLSGVSEADLFDLIEYGALTPTAPESEARTFAIDCVMKLQRAALIRQDLALALDSHGFASAMMFLNQMTLLEEQLNRDCPLEEIAAYGRQYGEHNRA